MVKSNGHVNIKHIGSAVIHGVDGPPKNSPSLNRFLNLRQNTLYHVKLRSGGLVVELEGAAPNGIIQPSLLL